MDVEREDGKDGQQQVDDGTEQEEQQEKQQEEQQDEQQEEQEEVEQQQHSCPEPQATVHDKDRFVQFFSVRIFIVVLSVTTERQHTPIYRGH